MKRTPHRHFFNLALSACALWITTAVDALADAQIPDRVDRVYLKSDPENPIACTIVAESTTKLLVVLTEDSSERVLSWSDVKRVERGANTPMTRGVRTEVIDGEKCIIGEGYRTASGADNVLKMLLDMFPGIDFGGNLEKNSSVRILPGFRSFIADKITGEKKGLVNRPLKKSADKETPASITSCATAWKAVSESPAAVGLGENRLANLGRLFRTAWEAARSGNGTGISELERLRAGMGVLSSKVALGPKPALMPSGWKDPTPAPEQAKRKKHKKEEKAAGD